MYLNNNYLTVLPKELKIRFHFHHDYNFLDCEDTSKYFSGCDPNKQYSCASQSETCSDIPICQLNESICSPICGETTVVSGDHCIHCPDNCKTCQDGDSCIECQDMYKVTADQTGCEYNYQQHALNVIAEQMSAVTGTGCSAPIVGSSEEACFSITSDSYDVISLFAKYFLVLCLL